MISDKIYNVIIGALFIVIILLMVTIYIIDGKRADARSDALESLQKETEALIEVARVTNELNTKTVEVVEKVNTVYVETSVKEKPQIEYITKNVEKLVMLPSYSNVCFDATGLQYANALITRTYSSGDTTASSEPSR